MLVVSHDLDAISSTCDRVAVMYGGRIVESGPAAEVFRNPLHPYTRLLLSCQRLRRGEPLPSVPGEALNLIDFPPGCSFHPRCPLATSVCSRLAPEETAVGPVKVSCHYYGQRNTA